MRRPWRTHGPLLAFVLLAFVGGIALHGQQMQTSNKLYQNNYKSCVRGNKVRVNQSHIVSDLRTSNQIVEQFIGDAAVARANSYAATHVATDAKAAQEYEGLQQKLILQTSKLQSFPPVNCDVQVKKP